MQRIKDEKNLKDLVEKFGFEEFDYHYCFNGPDYDLLIIKKSKEIYINYLDSSVAKPSKLYDLIQAGYVEKVGD